MPHHYTLHSSSTGYDRAFLSIKAPDCENCAKYWAPGSRYVDHPQSSTIQIDRNGEKQTKEDEKKQFEDGRKY